MAKGKPVEAPDVEAMTKRLAELKARAYDLLADLQRAQQYLGELNAEIARLAAEIKNVETN